MIEYAITKEVGCLIILSFSVLWILLGWHLGRGSNTSEEFQLAGRRVGFSLATATAIATWVTTNTTLVAPELAYNMGMWGILGYSMGSLGLLLFAPIAVRIRRLLPLGTTSGDFIRTRYGKPTWRLFLLVSMIYSISWLVSLGMAGGILVESLTGIPYQIGLSVILFICMSYTFLGGLKAVIGTDFIQTVLIFLGITFIGVIGYREVSTQELYLTLEQEKPMLLNLFFPAALIFLFNNILFGIGEIFHSNVWWSRTFAFREDICGKAFFWSGMLWIPVPIVAGYLAFLAPARGIQIPYPDMVGVVVAGNLLGEWGGILVFILIFSALASSLDSLLAATSDLIAEDIYKGHINPYANDADLNKAGKISIIILGLTAWVICLPRISDLATVLHFSGALVSAMIWPILLGLFWNKSNRRYAFLGIFFGSFLGLIGYFTLGFYTAAIIGTGVSMLICILGSMYDPEEFEWSRSISTSGRNNEYTF